MSQIEIQLDTKSLRSGSGKVLASGTLGLLVTLLLARCLLQSAAMTSQNLSLDLQAVCLERLDAVCQQQTLCSGAAQIALQILLGRGTLAAVLALGSGTAHGGQMLKKAAKPGQALLLGESVSNDDSASSGSSVEDVANKGSGSDLATTRVSEPGLLLLGVHAERRWESSLELGRSEHGHCGPAFHVLGVKGVEGGGVLEGGGHLAGECGRQRCGECGKAGYLYSERASVRERGRVLVGGYF